MTMTVDFTALQLALSEWQVFGARFCDGRLAPSGQLIRHCAVEDALRHIGQGYAGLGAGNIWHDPLVRSTSASDDN